MLDVFNDEIPKISFDTERYLLSLFESIEIGNGRLSTTKLSEQLDLSPSTISNKLKNLNELRISDRKIINYEKRYGTTLTHTGLVLGALAIRKNRLKELFLKNLGLSLQEIDCQINQIRLNKRVSELIYKGIIDQLSSLTKAEKLNLRCPHGSLIPDENGNVAYEIFNPITFYPSNTSLTLHRLASFICNKERKKYYFAIRRFNLTPGKVISEWRIEKGKLELTLLDGNQIILDEVLSQFLFFTDKSYSYIIP